MARWIAQSGNTDNSLVSARRNFDTHKFRTYFALIRFKIPGFLNVIRQNAHGHETPFLYDARLSTVPEALQLSARSRSEERLNVARQHHD